MNIIENSKMEHAHTHTHQCLMKWLYTHSLTRCCLINIELTVSAANLYGSCPCAVYLHCRHPLHKYMCTRLTLTCVLHIIIHFYAYMYCFIYPLILRYIHYMAKGYNQTVSTKLKTHI